MPFINTNELETGQRLPGWTHRLFNTENMTFAHFTFEAGARIHEHSHSNEEVWTVLEGELEVSVGGDSMVAGPGFVAVVPPFNAHSVKALTDGKAIVTDSPVRVDQSAGRRGVVRVDFESPLPLAEYKRGAELHIPFTLHNWGKSRVAVRELSIEARTAPTPPTATKTEIPDGEMPTLCNLEDDEQYRGTVAYPEITPSDITNILEGSAMLYVKGVIIYDDAFGGRQHSTFCRVFDPVAFDGAGGFVNPERPGYNYGS